MEIIGYAAAMLIGVSLGLIGSGGSILTVPILVYLFKVPPVLATAYSLFIVGCSSAMGTLQKWKRKEVDLRTVLWLGLPSLVTVFLFRKAIVPLIPDALVTFGTFVLYKDTAILLLFALLMIVSAIALLRPAPPAATGTSAPLKSFRLILQGIQVGIVCGLLGAGGGFIIIPSLILFAQLDIRKAIGTSLMIIALNTLIGFTGDLSHTTMDWPLLLSVTALALTGTLIGHAFSRFISSEKLKTGFGYFILVMGLYIIFKETVWPF